jgi:hypothetical protein
VNAEIDALARKGVHHVPGFGHRFHPTDPRAPRLLQLVDEAANAGHVRGVFATIGRPVEKILARRKGRKIPMNIDGATAVVFAELGFAPALCRGLFVLVALGGGAGARLGGKPVGRAQQRAAAAPLFVEIQWAEAANSEEEKSIVKLVNFRFLDYTSVIVASDKGQHKEAIWVSGFSV